MTINFFEKSITPEQYKLPEEMRGDAINALQDYEWGFADSGVIWRDIDGLMWIDSEAACYKPTDFPDDKIFNGILVRVIKLVEGYVVDISSARQNFEAIPNTPRIELPPKGGPSYAYDGYKYAKEPVIGFITSVMERSIFQNIVEETYGFKYPDVETQNFSD